MSDIALIHVPDFRGLRILPLCRGRMEPQDDVGDSYQDPAVNCPECLAALAKLALPRSPGSACRL